jgi:hypothetical protein
MRPRHPPAPTHAPDPLSRRYRVTFRHIHPAQMEVPGHESRAVIQVYRAPREIEVRH